MGKTKIGGRRWAIKHEHRNTVFVATSPGDRPGRINQASIIIPAKVQNHEAIELVKSGVPSSFFEGKNMAELKQFEGHQERLVEQITRKVVQLGPIQGTPKVAKSVDKGDSVKVKLYESIGVAATKSIIAATIEGLTTNKNLRKAATALGLSVPEEINPDFIEKFYNEIH
jgi:hypothetical protein